MAAGEYLSIADFNSLAAGALIGEFTRDSTSALSVIRTTSGNTKTGTGTGAMRPSGVHTHDTNKSYRVTIDTAGDADQGATFKWSDDGGATYLAELIPVSALVRSDLQLGVQIQFAEGSYDLADQWDFTAIATGSQAYDLKVDTTNHIVQVGTELQVIDANFGLRASGGLRQLFFGAVTGLSYDPATEIVSWLRGGVTPFFVDSINSVFDISNNALQIEERSTPATPAAGRSKLYGKVGGSGEGTPHWLDDAGLEQEILPLVQKGDIYTFSTKPIALNVGANDTILMADSAQATGLKWVASATPVAVGFVLASGAADTFARGDHVHTLGTAGIIAEQATLGENVQALISTATNNDPTEGVVQNRVATTDATVTTLQVFTIIAGYSTVIEAWIVARRTGGAAGTGGDSAGYGIRGCFKNIGGTVSQVGATSNTFTAEDVAAYAVAFDVTGATARIRVTGVLSTDITWHVTARHWTVSN